MIFDRYLFRSLAGAFALTAFTLAAIIMLTQSLRFLELVINSGASSGAFWVLTLLALPRMFEVILPISLMVAVLFIYNRMAGDSEITAMRAAGFSPLRLSRPALVLAGIVTGVLLITTTWMGPAALNSMQKMRKAIKAEYSAMMLREGVFNPVGDTLTVYVRERGQGGELKGLMIHDSRPELKAPVTIIAARGIVVATDTGQQVLVFDGSRQDFNAQTGALNRLDFAQYSLDLPEPAAVNTRWREPEERSFSELLSPDPATLANPKSLHKFTVEIHRRLAAPFLALSFCIISLACLLIGPVDRRGQGRRLSTALVSVVLMEALYLTSFNLSQESMAGIVLMYVLIFLPIVGGLFLLSRVGEKFRRKAMYKAQVVA
jgi:lipopolysaccharide export system permease protein